MGNIKCEYNWHNTGRQVFFDGSTFDMSNLSVAEQQMQPYFSLDKASGTGLGDMNIDYIKAFSNRA